MLYTKCFCAFAYNMQGKVIYILISLDIFDQTRAKLRGAVFELTLGWFFVRMDMP